MEDQDYKSKILHFVLDSSNEADKRIATFIAGMQAQKPLDTQPINQPPESEAKTDEKTA
ncbi:MAG: hypothetical protein LBT14_00605 [Treponema sp.]|jgi:hypothetical protein|nr:hypothetical protein [Treponema sp.]